MHVMHGVVRGFRPRQRVDAASELLGHIARDEIARSGSLPVEPALSPAEEPALSAVEGSFPPDGSSFPRKREPIPSTDEADLTVIPAEPGIQGGGDEDGLPPSPSPLTGEGWGEGEGAPSFPRRACPVLDTGREPIPGPADADDTNDHRGCYDIDRKIAEAQRDPSHPIHKFVQAYDEVAAVFHGKDKENDEDDEVRYWISGEVPDAYGKYIWEYAPAYPRSIRRKLRPKRRRSREPGTTPKAESVWMKRPFDKMREAGIPRPSRFKIWV